MGERLKVWADDGSTLSPGRICPVHPLFRGVDSWAAGDEVKIMLDKLNYVF